MPHVQRSAGEGRWTFTTVFTSRMLARSFWRYHLRRARRDACRWAREYWLGQVAFGVFVAAIAWVVLGQDGADVLVGLGVGSACVGVLGVVKFLALLGHNAAVERIEWRARMRVLNRESRQREAVEKERESARQSAQDRLRQERELLEYANTLHDQGVQLLEHLNQLESDGAAAYLKAGRMIHPGGAKSQAEAWYATVCNAFGVHELRSFFSVSGRPQSEWDAGEWMSRALERLKEAIDRLRDRVARGAG